MPAQEKLTQIEQYLAYLTGLGIAIAMAALMLTALGTIENDNITISLLLVGLAMIVLGIGGWLILVRPWEKFDDLKSPFYTGHDEHPEPEAGAAVAETPAKEPEAKVAAVKKPAAEAAPAKEPAAAAKAAPEAVPEAVGEPDDLTLIEGVGPKSAAALAEAGITTYAQVAAMPPEALEEAIKSRKVRLVGSTETWPLQARLAAAGDLTALDAMKGRIKGGILHDDLTQIDGLGPKAQDALYDAGVRTFDDVAGSTPDALRAILTGAGMKSVKPDTWPEQASTLAKGG